MSNGTSGVTVAPTASGCLISLGPRATVRESRVVKDIATRTFKGDDRANVVVDISSCLYADSTFLGTLIDLFHTSGKTRFSISGPAEQRKKLLGVARLDKLIPGIDVAPATLGTAVPVPSPETTPREILRHVMECHQKLAEIDCPMRPIFARIATQMQAELEQHPDM